MSVNMLKNAWISTDTSAGGYSLRNEGTTCMSGTVDVSGQMNINARQNLSQTGWITTGKRLQFILDATTVSGTLSASDSGAIIQATTTNGDRTLYLPNISFVQSVVFHIYVPTTSVGCINLSRSISGTTTRVRPAVQSITHTSPSLSAPEWYVILPGQAVRVWSDGYSNNWLVEETARNNVENVWTGQNAFRGELTVVDNSGNVQSLRDLATTVFYSEADKTTYMQTPDQQGSIYVGQDFTTPSKTAASVYADDIQIIANTGSVNLQGYMTLSTASTPHVSFSQLPVYTGGASPSSNSFITKAYGDANYTIGGITSGNNTWSGTNTFSIAPTYSGNTAPSSTTLITKAYADATYTSSGSSLLPSNNSWTGTNSFQNTLTLLDASGNSKNLSAISNYLTLDASQVGLYIGSGGISGAQIYAGKDTSNLAKTTLQLGATNVVMGADETMTIGGVVDFIGTLPTYSGASAPVSTSLITKGYGDGVYMRLTANQNISGTKTWSSGGITVGGTAAITVNSNCNVGGSLTINGGTLTNSSSGTITNSGLIQNYATLNNYSTIYNEIGSTISNDGTISNSGVFTNVGQVYNNAYNTLHGSATFTAQQLAGIQLNCITGSVATLTLPPISTAQGVHFWLTGDTAYGAIIQANGSEQLVSDQGAVSNITIPAGSSVYVQYHIDGYWIYNIFNGQSTGQLKAASNTWSNTNNFSTYPPTYSGTNPINSSTQLITKGFADSTYVAQSSAITSSANNSFSGSNSFSNIVSHGVHPQYTGAYAPTLSYEYAPKSYVDGTVATIASGLVNTTTNQTIGGIKTFSSPPVMSGASITVGTIPTSAVASGFVDTSSTQTIGGVKTFSSPPVMSGASISTNTIPNSALVVQYVNVSGTQTITGTKTFSTAPTMSGANISAASIPDSALSANVLLTSSTLNGSNILTGMIPDEALSTNVVKTNVSATISANDTFSGSNTFSGTVALTGTLTNSNSIVNASGGTITNSGTIINQGKIYQQNVSTYTTSTTLSTGSSGKVVNVAGSGITMTLPLADSTNNGYFYTFQIGNYDITLASQSPNKFIATNGYSLTLKAGQQYLVQQLAGYDWSVGQALMGPFCDLSTTQTIGGTKTFSTAPVMSGASITSGTIPVASVSGTAVNLNSNQTLTSTKSFTSGGLALSSTATFDSANPLSMTNSNQCTSVGQGTTVLPSNSVLVGYNAGAAMTNAGSHYNTAVGHSAISTDVAGDYQTAVGWECLKAAGASTSTNTCIGARAGLNLTTGSGNSIIGTFAGQGLSNGSNNLIVGQSFTHSYATSNLDNNVCVGTYAMDSVGNGATANVAIGNYALYSDGSSPYTGAGSVAVGGAAGIRTGGNFNTFLGYCNSSSNFNTANAAYNYCTTIGYNAIASASNQIVLGTSSETTKIPGNLNVSGTITLPSASIADAALSSNVVLENVENIFTPPAGQSAIKVNKSGGGGYWFCNSNSDVGFWTGSVNNWTVSSAGLITTSGGLTVSAGTITLPSASIADAALSSNVALLTGTQTISGNKTFSGTCGFSGVSPYAKSQYLKATFFSAASTLSLASGTLYSTYALAPTANMTITLPTASSTYEGVEIIFRRVGGTTTTTVLSASTNIYNGQNVATNQILAASGNYQRIMCLQNSSTPTYIWIWV